MNIIISTLFSAETLNMIFFLHNHPARSTKIYSVFYLFILIYFIFLLANVFGQGLVLVKQ